MQEKSENSKQQVYTIASNITKFIDAVDKMASEEKEDS